MKKYIFYTLCLLFLVGNLYSQQTVWVKATASGLADGSSEANAFGGSTGFASALAQINSATDVLRVVGTVSAFNNILNTKNFQYTIEGDAGGSTLNGSSVIASTRMFSINGASVGQNVTFRNITFTGSIASTLAGGGSVFYSNQAGVTINFENCRFNTNTITNSATVNAGGALNFSSTLTNATVTITNCLFNGNTATRDGGAITFGNFVTATLTRCTFYKNKTTSTTAAQGGGALLVSGASTVVNVNNCTFFQNTTGITDQNYGAIRHNSGKTYVSNSLFYDNKVNNDAGSPGDFSGPTQTAALVATLTNSLAQYTNANVTNTNSTVSATITLGSSNLTYDDTSGKVRFRLAAVGDATPIAFGSDGDDVGAWDCGTRVAPTFTQVAAICSGATLSALPTTSNNGITGTWSPALNNTATTTYTFTPAVGQCASSTATMTITVNSGVTPTFAQVAAICSGSSLSALPTTSTNTTGITGTWSPALNNTATTEYTFTPTAGQCATTATMTITVNPATTTGSETVAEPTGSYTWALNSQTYTATGTYTYVTGCNTATLNLTTNVSSSEPTITSLTSDGTTVITQGCAGATLVITGTNFVGVTAVTVNGVAVASYVVNSATQITATLPAGAIASGAVVVTTTLGGASTTGGNFAVNANVTPTFTAVAAICSGGSLSALPTTSDNSYTGTWSPALNNAATTEYTFTPTAGQCATTAVMTITVNSPVTPTFTQVATICAGVSLSALPTTSNNSISGSWSPALNNAATTQYTFTPTAGQCASTATMTITVNTACTKTFTWNGSTSNDWATAANWTTTGDGPDTFPGQTKSTDIVVISNGGTPVVSSGTYGMISLAINNTTGGNTGSILTINSGATLTVNNTSATAAAVAITLKGGSIVNNGTLNATATNTGASFGIACLVPSVAPTSASEYGYSGSGALNINTTQGNASSGGIQFSGTVANTTYKMLFNGTTTFSLNNTALAVYALRVAGGAKGPVIIGGAGFTLGTVGVPVNYGLLTMGNNGNNVTVNSGTTLTLNSAATNTAIGINIAQTVAASADVNFTNKGTIAILGASSTAGINLNIDNSTNVLPAINKINFENQGTLNVDLAIGSSSNSAALRVQGAGTTAGLATITNTGTGILNLKNAQPYTAVTGCPIRIFATANTPAVTIDNAGTLSFTGQSINFGGSATKSAINNTGIINSSSEFQSFTVTNGTAGTINFNYNTPATSRSVKFTVGLPAAAAAGATYTDANSNVYTVVFTKVNGTLTELSGGFALTGTTPASGTLTKTAGTGDATIAYSAITLYEASPLSASDSAFINNGTVNTGTATNLNTFAAVTTSGTSVIAPGGTGVGNTVIANASTVALNGTLKLDIQSIVSSTAFDQITNSATGGGFDITNATLDLTGIFTPLGNRTISILTTNATGTLTGNFFSVIGLESNPRWSIRYTTGTAGKVQLVYTANTWTGATSTDWTNAGNWNNGVPTVSTDVTIAYVTNKPIISSNVSVASLTLNTSSSLTVNSGYNLTVTGAVANSGTMTLENNANLIQGGTTNTNTGNVIVKRNSNPLYILDYTMWSSPVSGTQTLAQFSPLTSIDPNIRFYTYNPVNNLYANAAPTSTFATGTGYLIRMPKSDATTNYNEGTAPLTYNGQFTGIPNNGTLTLSGLTAGKFYAVGNPYPSTISANAFINGNSTGGTLYFWRKRNAQAGSSYATYNLVGTTVTASASGNGSSVVPNGTIQVGQGFIVKTGVAATSLAFTNAMRVANNENQFFKTKQVQKDRIWLNLIRPATKIGAIDIPEAFSQALIGYMDGATLGVDEGIDGKYINDSEVALTSSINDEEYTIQGRPAFDPTDVVALNFKTDTAGDYTIALDHFDGAFAAGQDVYLLDSKTGTETDLKIVAYTFSATAGMDNARFSLKYQKTLKVDAPVFNENSVSVYKKNGTIYVNSGKIAINSIQVYDVQGRLIADRKNVKSSTATLENLKANNQVLLVKISGEDNSVVTKKIVN